MPWFRVDDKFHSHRKTRKILRSVPGKRRDASALGLWTAAGSWCSDNLTDGFVPADELETWDDDGAAIAERLVAAGFWLVDTVDDEPGYRFKDWTEKNPDAVSVRARRDAESEGGQRGNHVRWHEGRDLVVADCDFCTAKPSGTRSGSRSGQTRATRLPGESSRPGPSRPTAAAAAGDAKNAAAAADLPGPISILASKIRSHTALAGLRFDTLSDEQTTHLVSLIEQHGDDRLVAVARDTLRDPAPTYVTAFLGTWTALPPPGRTLHAVVARYCPTHSTKLTPAGVCSGCSADQRVGDTR